MVDTASIGVAEAASATARQTAIRLSHLRRLEIRALPAAMASPPAITVSKGAATMTGAGYAHIGKDDARLTVARGVTTQMGTSYPTSLYNIGASVTYGVPSFGLSQQANLYSMRFETDAPAFEFLVGGYSVEIGVEVDGVPVSTVAPVFNCGSDGQLYYIKLNFGPDVRTLRPNGYTVSVAGSGYAVGDTFTLSGGTGSSPTFGVTSVSSGGGIQTVRILAQDAYSVLPPSPASVVGGSGSGATLALTTSLIKLGHTSKAMRKIEIFGAVNFAFGGLNVGQYDTVRPWVVPAGPRMIVVGDSWCEGSYHDYPGGQYSAQLSKRLGVQDGWISGVGGQGFLTGSPTINTSGRPNYLARLQTDVLAYRPTDLTIPFIPIIQGSENDGTASTTALQAQAQAIMSALYAAGPNVYPIMIGSVRSPGANTQGATAAAVKAGFLAAQAAGDPNGRRSGFVDIFGDGLMNGTGFAGGSKNDGNCDDYIASDGAHPVQAGHDLMAHYGALKVLELIAGFAA